MLATGAVAAGFALAGLRTTTADTPDESRAQVRALTSDASLAVLLIEEAVLGELPASEQTVLAGREQPIVVPFTSPSWVPTPSSETALILEILRRAIGYRVRLQ